MYCLASCLQRANFSWIAHSSRSRSMTVKIRQSKKCSTPVHDDQACRMQPRHAYSVIIVSSPIKLELGLAYKKVHSERTIFESSKWIGRISQRTKTQIDGSFFAFPLGNKLSGSEIAAGSLGCQRQTI